MTNCHNNWEYTPDNKSINICRKLAEKGIVLRRHDVPSDKIHNYYAVDFEPNSQGINTATSASEGYHQTTFSPREFEQLARKIMADYLGVLRLDAGQRAGWPKRFDLVSPNGQVVGDAKYYTMVRGKYIPPAKFSIISEHGWLLENTQSPHRFLVFGNDVTIPLEWLKRYDKWVKSVRFYFLSESGEVRVLK